MWLAACVAGRLLILLAGFSLYVTGVWLWFAKRRRKRAAAAFAAA